MSVTNTRAAVFMPANPATRWDHSDLVRRVVDVLDLAHRMVQSIAETSSAPLTATVSATVSATRDVAVAGLMREKVVSETAMLLLCVEPLCRHDERIAERFETIGALLAPLARHDDVIAGICLDPAHARDHSIGHIILSHLGYPDPRVDALLSRTLAMGPNFGPERPPHRVLEQSWLARLWDVVEPPTRRDADLVADSMLGRPMDALGSTRQDIYAFTHAVMYASDLGKREIVGLRSPAAIVADADAALAHSLDANDFDLTAEVLMTWPMLGLAWSPAATFAFGILADLQDALGFLPGLVPSETRYLPSAVHDPSRIALTTSYHSTYVMGFLCAAALAPGREPPATVSPARHSRGVAAALLSLIGSEMRAPCWVAPLRALSASQQDAVAQLLLNILLRRARGRGNVKLVRDALEVALAFDLIDGPAPSQAAALLRRTESVVVPSETRNPQSVVIPSGARNRSLPGRGL